MKQGLTVSSKLSAIFIDAWRQLQLANDSMRLAKKGLARPFFDLFCPSMEK
jgi:hypothetical protein